MTSDLPPRIATCGLRSATGAPYKGAHDQPTSPAFQGTSPIRGGITMNDIAEGDKPLTTSHEPRDLRPQTENNYDRYSFTYFIRH